MNRIWKLATLALAVAVALPTFGQELYTATKSVGDQKISLVGWGNGRIAEVDDMAYEGAVSLRISSRNYFQGGKLMYANPIDLSSAYGDKSNLLLFTFDVPGKGTGSAAGGLGGGRAGGGRAGVGGGRPGGGRAGAGSAPGGLGAAGGPPTTGGSTTTSELKMIRVVVGTTDGNYSEGYLDITNSIPGTNGWFSVGIPLQAISGLGKTNKIVNSVAISGDAIATYYLGSLKVLSDTTPVYAEPNVRDLNLAFGDEVTLFAGGSAGATPVKFIWDFDSRDGIQDDAEGQTVKHRFRTPGEFEVTLTAVDIYGLKAPYTTKIKVTVNP